MTALFKKEFLRYVFRLETWIIWAVTIFLTGAFFGIFHVYFKYASISYTLVFVGYADTILIPILACRLYSDVAKSGEERWLTSCSVSWDQRVTARYLAALSVVLIGNAPLLLLPLILKSSSISPAVSYGLIGLFYLLLACLVSFSMFASSFFKKRLPGTLISILCLGIMLISSSLMHKIPAAPLVSYIIFLFLSWIWLPFFRWITHRWLPAILVPVGCMVADTVLFIAAPQILHGAVAAFFDHITVYTWFSYFSAGVLPIGGVLFYLLFTLCFMRLTKNAQVQQYVSQEVKSHD